MKKRSNGEGSYTKLPSGKWRVQIMVGYSADGKKKVKSFTAPTKSEAQQMVREFLANAKIEQSNANLVLFSEWAETWYDDYKTQVEESTYWNYGFTLKKLKDYFGGKLISEIKPIDINRFIDSLIEQDYSKSVNSIDETTISRILMRQVNTLFLENVGQLDMAITKAMRPEQVTPLFAADKYLGDFMTGLMANASPESIVKQQEKVKKALSLLPCVPIARLSKREVNTILESNKVSNKTRNICSAFFEFLITTKKCTGKNPIKIAPTEDSSEFSQNKSAFTTQELSEDVFKKLFEILNKKETCLNCVIALLISGFSKSDVNNLIWGNIEFTKEKDLVIVHINRDYSGISKHDFSRPAIINTARYLKRVYQSLRAADEEIDGKPIFPYEDRSKTNLSNEVNNILVRAGFAGKLALPGRPGDGEESIPLMILQNNYRRMLISKAGLKDDPDTLAFLSGQLLKSSTFVNYESHTSPDAQKRLFTILKPLAVEEKISKKSGVSEAHGQTVFFGVPATTHEVVRVIGTVNLPPGKTLTIRVPHGGTGVLDSDFCRKG